MVWFRKNYKRKYVKNPILVNLGTQISKKILVQIVVVPPEETYVSKLLTALFIFIRPLLFESWFGGPVYADVDKYGHVGISLLTKMYQIIV